MVQQATIVVSAKPSVVDLKQEIHNVIAPHIHSELEPPFSPLELSIMAWVCCRGDANIVTGKQIYNWMVRTFDYYNGLAVEDIKDCGYFSARGVKSTIGPFLRSLADRNTSPDMPLYQVFRLDHRGRGINLNGSRAYASTLTSSRKHLCRVLGNESQGSFSRFLDLPAEIRDMIYSEVLSHEATLELLPSIFFRPPERRTLQSHRYVPKVTLDNTALSDAGWHRPEVRHVITEPSGNFLALLSVSRQVFQEAMPVFYSVNTFKARDVRNLIDMLQLCGERRRACFSQIELVRESTEDLETLETASNLLADVKHLKHLTIHATDELAYYWSALGCDVDAYRADWTTLLRGVGLQSIRFSKDCPILEAFIREHRSKLNDTDGNVATGKQKQSVSARKHSKKDV